MKKNYIISQYGCTSHIKMVCVYNWEGLNKIGLACYSEYFLSGLPDLNLVAIFKVKYK